MNTSKLKIKTPKPLPAGAVARFYIGIDNGCSGAIACIESAAMPKTAKGHRQKATSGPENPKPGNPGNRS